MSSINIGDIELNVEDQGTGPVLLLVHGFPLDHSMWQGQIAGLSATRRVIAPDLRGFGQSKADDEKVTMQQFADDLAALLDAMKIDEPIAYCGLSMGGYIGWQFLQRHRKRVSHFIQCDTKAKADDEEARATRLKGADLVLKVGAEPVVATMMPKLFAESTVANQPAIVEATKTVMNNTSPQAIAAALRGMSERPDVTEMLSEIDVPTLILCGEHDAISPPEEMRTIADAIPGARYVEIAGAGHMAPLEDPAAVNAAIEEFLG